MKGIKIPGVFYLYLHLKLWENFGDNEMSEKEVKKMLFQWKIPTNLRILIIKEMQIMKLIIKESRYKIRLNRPNFNDNKIKEYYSILKIF